MIKTKTIFSEDECLRHDPDYPGIRGWWKDTFGRSFIDDWNAAIPTEVDGGDSFTRTILLDGNRWTVILAPDGYSVRGEDSWVPAAKRAKDQGPPAPPRVQIVIRDSSKEVVTLVEQRLTKDGNLTSDMKHYFLLAIKEGLTFTAERKEER